MQDVKLDKMTTRNIPLNSKYIINNYENSGVGIVIKNEDFLFTDWAVGDGDEAKKFGTVGVEVVKDRIRDNLVSYGICKEEEEEEEDELRRCLSTLRV